ncbi:hypothetical protein [Pedobacter endophyticus]|uniref:DUF4296 domain-containing protein n=1 Tax=Pedobacter endophyticus TaxID=2789740 RepID=A0A7S9KZP2_9SPHI|nr:hypothetical protein [Pedobacter endophyticus]QPH39559.1 hypothetical protein IZT61_21385 [Pedobacter endophyticus]
MKNLLPILLSVVFACKSNSTSNNALDSMEEDTFGMMNPIAAVNLVDSAQGLIDQSSTLVKKGISGELKKRTVDSLVNPIMVKYLAVFKQLSPSDSLIVHKYRQQKINELLEFQSKKYSY